MCGNIMFLCFWNKWTICEVKWIKIFTYFSWQLDCQRAHNLFNEMFCFNLLLSLLTVVTHARVQFLQDRQITNTLPKWLFYNTFPLLVVKYYFHLLLTIYNRAKFPKCVFLAWGLPDWSTYYRFASLLTSCFAASILFWSGGRRRNTNCC